LKLAEDYTLAIKSIEGYKVYLELSKDGSVVDTKVVSPSKDNADELDKTYYYKNPKVGNQNKLVTIGVHFKNAFRGASQDLASIDGIWQISDTPTEVKADTEYDKMTINTVDATNGVITMNNKDNAITLTRNMSMPLMGDLRIKTADNDTHRFYIYKEITEPGDYQIRGAVAGTINGQSNLVDNSFTWDPQTFAGFYYDINNDLGAEQMQFSLTEGNKLSGDDPYGIVYTTTAQRKNFAFRDWGDYDVIDFLGNEYFARYNQEGTTSDILSEANSTNLLESGYLTQVLYDDGQEKVIDIGSTIALAEGYTLKPTLGTDTKGILVELLRDGKMIDREALILPGSYIYISRTGNTTGLPVIAAHFEEPIILDDKSCIKEDGLWQLSEKTNEIKADAQYGNMSLRSVDPNDGKIILDNKGNSVTLSKNKDTELMSGIHIKTADNDTLRSYIYKIVKVALGGRGK